MEPVERVEPVELTSIVGTCGPKNTGCRSRKNWFVGQKKSHPHFDLSEDHKTKVERPVIKPQVKKTFYNNDCNT